MKWIKSNAGRGNSTRLGRQQTDFRINKTKTNVKKRTSTANSRRNTAKPTLISSNNLNSESHVEVLQYSTNSNISKAQIPEKRAQSQHNERKKINKVESKERQLEASEDIKQL